MCVCVHIQRRWRQRHRNQRISLVCLSLSLTHSLSLSFRSPSGSFVVIMCVNVCEFSRTFVTLCEGATHKGRIAEGCDADLVLLTEDLEVQASFVGGELAWKL